MAVHPSPHPFRQLRLARRPPRRRADHARSPDVRVRPPGLERHDRQAAGGDRALRRRRRRRPRRPLRRRARAAARRPRRRPQRRRHRRGRRRPRDRPVGDARRCASTAPARTVHVQGGATWADVDEVTAPLGLAAPGGVVSETGVAGLALSGGVSHQRRRDGMTIDNLVSAEVVLADGRRVRASADEHRDLYWALRGGGGNFGVVTSFELRLHELGPEVFALNVAYPIEDAARVLRRLARRRRRRAGRAVDRRADLVAAGRRRAARAAARRCRYVGVAGMWAGDPAEGERATRRPARAGHPAARHERRRWSTSTSSARSTRSSRRARATTGRRSTWTGSPTPRSTPRSTGPTAARRTTRW